MNHKNSNLSRKIWELLDKSGFAPYASKDKVAILRTRAGYWQRAQGAWSWELVTVPDGKPAQGDKYMHAGSIFAASDCIRASKEKIEIGFSRFGDLEINIKP